MFVLPVPDYERLPRYRRLLRDIDARTRAEALEAFLPTFGRRYRQHLASPRLDYRVRIGEGDAILRALQKRGCSLSRIDPALKAALAVAVGELPATLERELDSLEKPRFKDGQRPLDRTEHAGVFEALDDIFRAEHLYDVARAYAGRPLTLAAATLQVNTAASTTSHYGPIEADGLPARKTQYFHIDSAGWPAIKVLIYLDPVGPEQGPFRYVAGSHRVADDYELVARKTNDKLKLAARLFLALPPAFRVHADFGDLMDPRDPKAAALAARERVLCDGASDLILFDYNGVHRGGFVRDGSRRMLQVTFDNAP